MQSPLQITFRGIAPTEPIQSYVLARADKLEKFSSRITGCHVTIETPHMRHGRHYSVRIDLAVPGDEIVVTRDPAHRKGHEDLYASINAAFDDAKRLLEDHVRTRRGEVKTHETPSSAPTRLFRDPRTRGRSSPRRADPGT